MLETAHRIAKDVGAKIDDREGPSARREVFPLGAARRARWFWNWARATWPPATSCSNGATPAPRKCCRKPTSSTRIPAVLAQMQTDLYAAAKQRLQSNTVLANSIDEVESILADVTAEKGGGKFVMAHLKDDPACDARLKEFKATVRCIPLVDEYDGPGKCIVTGEPVDRRVVIAKSY